MTPSLITILVATAAIISVISAVVIYCTLVLGSRYDDEMEKEHKKRREKHEDKH